MKNIYFLSEKKLIANLLWDKLKLKVFIPQNKDENALSSKDGRT